MEYFKIKPHDLGPVYGPIDNCNLPVLGLPHYYEGFHADATEIPKGYDIPMIMLEPGFGNLTEIKLIDGDFECRGQFFDPALPTLWCPEDCQTVSKLVYGQADLYLPYTHVHFKENDFTLLSSKESLVPWFDKTFFGMTQFCVYYWIKVMALFPEYLVIGKDDLVHPNAYEAAFSLIENLKNLKAREAFTSDDYFYIRPANFNTELTNIGKDDEGNDICTLKLHGLGLAFEVWKPDGEKHAVNEQFTIEYSQLFGNLLYNLLPVFDRYNILLSMFYGMHQIKEAGLKPSQEFFETILTNQDELL